MTTAPGESGPAVGLPRAREELFAGHVLATTGFAAQAVLGAHRAALAAAEAALLLLDRAPDADPAVVVAAFVRHVVRERGIDPESGRLLRSLHNRALVAHDDGLVPHDEAAAALADATRVLDVVGGWIAASERVAAERGPARPRRRVTR